MTKRILTRVAILFLITLLVIIFRPRKHSPSKSNHPPTTQTPSTPPRPPVLADQMLVDFGSPKSSDQQDLESLSTFVDSVFLQIKNRDSREFSTNQDLVLFLAGKNKAQLRFLYLDSPYIDKDGKLLDRRKQPIIVHPRSQKQIELRFAGPDQTPYTADDLLWPKPIKT